VAAASKGATVAEDTDDTDPTEELGLVRSWLARPGVRVLRVDGELASPVAGGAALASTVAEAGRLAGRLRRDHQVLGGRKVRRRATTPATTAATTSPAATTPAAAMPAATSLQR
jgi:hypothetical protein